MIRKLSVALLAVVMAAGMMVGMPGAGAQTPENPNLDLSIDPAEGPPGTVIDTFVDPAQAQAECIVDLDQLEDEILAIVAELEALAGAPLDTLLGILEGQIPDILDGLGLDIALFYQLVFVDIVTQEQLASGTWEPITGTGQITAPDEPFGTYAVAAACVGLNEIDLEDLLAALVAAVDLTALGICLADQPDPCIGAFVEQVAGIVLGALLPDPEDPNIQGLGFELYCLGDAAFCSPDPDPDDDVTGPVTATPTFTG